MGSTVRISVLGPVALVVDGRDVTPRGALQRRLLCGLVLRAPAAASTDELAGLLWPDGLPADHQAALQTHVFRLRRLLPDGALSTTATGYRIDVGPEAVDATRFEAAVHAAAAARTDDAEQSVGRLDEALGWWRGTPYDELGDVDGARIEASRLDELRARATEDRLDCLLALGRHAESLADLEAVAASEPLRERPQALLMLGLHRSGRRVDALAVFDRFRRLLAEELGIEPSAALRELHDAVVTDDVAPASPPLRVRRLPRHRTSFVGRDDLVREVVDRVASERLVTLVGPGGVGKTRLAVEAAAALGEPVWFCELAAAGPDSVDVTVATALGIDERAGVGLLDRVVEVLGAQGGLVVLDNCEHVLDEAARAADAILGGAADVRILATSRERLTVDGENLCPVPPLPVAVAEPGDPAVRLFVDRAQALRPGWIPGRDELAVVAEVCRRLDGLPLAIELAAARLHTMTLDEVAAGIESRFGLLTGGRRTETRHRSLAAAVSWSYDLLEERERELFDAVSVFQSPFPALAAAELVGSGLPEAVDRLSGLVERSLVFRSGARYGMLESLRHFGAARLDERGRSEELRHRHASLHVELAEAGDARLRSETGRDVFADLDASLADLRVAFRHLLHDGDVDGVLRLCLALRDYGYYGLRPEVLGWAGAAAELALEKGHDPRAADALAIASIEAWNRGEHERSDELARRGRAVMDATGAPSFHVLIGLGNGALQRGHLAEALAWVDAALAFAPTQPDELRRIELDGSRVLVLGYAGDATTSEAVDGLLAGMTPSTPELVASWAWYVAGEAVVHTDPPLAAERLARSAELARSCGSPFLLGIAGASAASIEARHGDPAAAIAEYRWLLAHWQRAGIKVVQWNMLRAVTELLARTGCQHAAAVLLGAVTATEAGHAVYGEDSHRLATMGDALRSQLGTDAFEAALMEGLDLDDDGAVAVALTAFDTLS